MQFDEIAVSEKQRKFIAVKTSPELTVIIPTYNEYENISILIERLKAVLKNIDWEIVVVDDNSPDNTAQAVLKIGEQDKRVRCIRRINRRGLSGAFLEGVLASHSTYVAVLDGDLQHDETLLPQMFKEFSNTQVDVVVASRYAEGGSASSFSTWRARFSNWATQSAKHFFGIEISDPMSGFFMIKRSVLEALAPKLKTEGFKILLDILTTSKTKLTIKELPFVFRKREHGKSKLDTQIMLDFVSLVLNKLTANIISARFLLFSFVGSLGLGLHMLLLNLFLHMGIIFSSAQAITTLIVIACNFTLNNQFTYADQRLVGKAFLSGLLRFELICSVGLISNVGVASWVFSGGNTWWLAGLTGACMGVVWNYLVSAALVWKKSP